MGYGGFINTSYYASVCTYLDNRLLMTFHVNITINDFIRTLIITIKS